MLTALRDVIYGLVGPNAGIGIADPKDAEHGLLAPEPDYITRAVPKRRMEFAAGRRAARAAMAEIGLTPSPIPKGPAGEPIWPQGVMGSISHCDSCCIAIVSQTHVGLGVDVEEATPLPLDLVDIVCVERERAWLESLPPADRTLAAKCIFGAKEALYKAIYPLTKSVIGFEDVELDCETDGSGLRGRFRTKAALGEVNVRQVDCLIISLCADPTLVG